jgi:iron complex transport system substrate-binding protein
MLAMVAAPVCTAPVLADAATVQAAPQHVMSLNLCTDQLLLDLLPPERIASITYLARSRDKAFHWAEAERVPVNHGLAEEFLAQRPDLVLVGMGAYTTTAARNLLKRVGAPVVEVPFANSFEDIRFVTRTVAEAVGEVAAGEKLLATMDATLRELAAARPRQAIRVAGWSGGGSVPGKGTLFDAILTAAGGINIAATMVGERSGSFDIEELLAAHPDVLAYGAGSDETAPSRRTDVSQHPLILKIYQHRRVSYPEVLYSCGLPESAGAAVALRASLLAADLEPMGVLQ